MNPGISRTHGLPNASMRWKDGSRNSGSTINMTPRNNWYQSPKASVIVFLYVALSFQKHRVRDPPVTAASVVLRSQRKMNHKFHGGLNAPMIS